MEVSALQPVSGNCVSWLWLTSSVANALQLVMSSAFTFLFEIFKPARAVQPLRFRERLLHGEVVKLVRDVQPLAFMVWSTPPVDVSTVNVVKAVQLLTSRLLKNQFFALSYQILGHCKANKAI